MLPRSHSSLNRSRPAIVRMVNLSLARIDRHSEHGREFDGIICRGHTSYQFLVDFSPFCSIFSACFFTSHTAFLRCGFCTRIDCIKYSIVASSSSKEIMTVWKFILLLLCRRRQGCWSPVSMIMSSIIGIVGKINMLFFAEEEEALCVCVL